MIRALVVASLLVCATGGQAATYYVDGTAGADTNDGTARGALSGGHGAWATWGMWINRLNAGAILPGDQVLIRPGRYHVSDGTKGNWLVTGTGGTPGHNIVVSVDENYAGDIEVEGAAAPGVKTCAAGTHAGAGCLVDGDCPASTCTGALFNSNVTAWAQAHTCDGASAGAPCDVDADCIAGGVCANTPTAVYWTRMDANVDTTGNTGGTAFQPGANPGDPPTFFDILYSPPGTYVQMPTFSANKNQVWVYTEKGATCRASRSPWLCCTQLAGANNSPPGDQGCSGRTCCAGIAGTGDQKRSGRIYVHTASGLRPDLVSPPVEVPFGGFAIFWWNAPSATPTHDITFSTGGRRTTHFWWGEKSLMEVYNAHHITFEDADFRYNSGVAVPSVRLTFPPIVDAGSGWPRDNGGPFYLIDANAGATHQAHHFTFKNSTVGFSAGDENIHWGHFEANGTCASGTNAGKPCLDLLATSHCGAGVTCTKDTTPCTTADDCLNTSLGAASAVCECASPVAGTGQCAGASGTCIYSRNGANTFGTGLTVRDSPWAVPNGQAANANSGALSWPPGDGLNTAYLGVGWENIFHFWSPLGGGGQSPSCWIDQSPFEHYVGVTTASCQNLSAENANAALTEQVLWGWVVERSYFDGGMAQHAATASAVLHPASLVTACDGGPSGAGCPGGGSCCRGFSGIRGFNIPPTYLYHNVPGLVFRNNVMTSGYGTVFQAGQSGSVLANTPMISPNTVVGNVFDLWGDPEFEHVDGQIQFSPHFDGVWEDNIVVGHGGLLAGRATLMVVTPQSGTVLDYNDYQNVLTWSQGPTGSLTDASTLAAWRTLSGQEANSLAVDPLFGAGGFDLQAGSPLRNVGVNLASLFEDIHGTVRPQEVTTDIGADEISGGAVSTTTVPTTTSTSSTAVPTTTSTSTTVTTLPGTVGDLTIKCVDCTIFGTKLR